MHTVLVAPDALELEVLEIRGADFHHPFRVLRLASGERVRVVDGQGRARWARVERVERACGRLKLEEWAPALEETIAIELAVAVPRGERASWIVEKSTELGVNRLVLLRTERSVGSRPDSQLRERLRRVAQAALLQCGRARLPEVEGPLPLWHWLDSGQAGLGPTVVLDGTGLPYLAADFSNEPAIRILVGPEGGWSESERHEFARRKIPSWSLGPRPLRIDTAAIAAVARIAGTAQFDSRGSGA